VTDPITIRQVVDDRSWTIRVDDGEVTEIDSDEADVTITTDEATAAAIRSGELAAQDALAQGRLRLGGDLTKLLALRSTPSS
jgi:putative sterol carrier protein